MTVLKILIELGWFDVVVVCVVLTFILYKAINRPKNQTIHSEILSDIHNEDKKKDPQKCEVKNGDEKVLQSGKETESIEFTFKGETPENKRKQNAESKEPLKSKSSSTDYSTDDSSKPAPQKSSSEKNVSDDLKPFTEVMNSISNSADSMKIAENVSGREKLKKIKNECLKIASFFDRCNQRCTNGHSANKCKVRSVIIDLKKEVKIKIKKFSKLEKPGRTAIGAVDNFHLLFLNMILDAFRNFSIQARIRTLCTACDSLSKGF